jgi:hypothetical protein
MKLQHTRLAPKNVAAALMAFVTMLLAGTLTADELLPRPESPFTGKIGLTYKDSTPVKPKLKVPATFGLEDPPNILLVLIDDCGYGQMGTFGLKFVYFIISTTVCAVATSMSKAPLTTPITGDSFWRGTTAYHDCQRIVRLCSSLPPRQALLHSCANGYWKRLIVLMPPISTIPS